MKKRLFSAILVVIMILSLTACYLGNGQSGNDVFCLTRSLINFQNIVIQFFLFGGQLFKGHHTVPHDGSEKVVEFVGDAGGKGADGLQPLVVPLR